MEKISKKQYDLYVFFTRSIMTRLFYEEKEWYINEARNLWGMICFDYSDKNYSVVISARDENRQVRCIDVETDFDTIELAREWLFSRVNEKEKELEKVDESQSTSNKQFKKKNVTDIFKPIVKESKLNDFFKFVSESPSHVMARTVINEIMPHFFDVDHNFVEQFQTQGFDARLWELYLFSYFNEEGFSINRQYEAPDFLISYDGVSIGVEAVVVSNQEKGIPQDIFKDLDKLAEKKEAMPIKWGSSLTTKLNHRNKDNKHYWEYDHIKGKPFVIAIADFHETFSMLWSQESLMKYLYGYEYGYAYDKDNQLVIEPKKIETHTNGRKVIPSGFFLNVEGTENISAVIHSSCATISKFNRIGKQCGFDKNNILMYRVGTRYNPDPNAVKPDVFQYIVDEDSNETWGEGITVFHNPRAKYPIPLDFFDNATQCRLENGLIVTYFKEPTVYSSYTMDFMSEKTISKEQLNNFKDKLFSK